MQAEMFTAPLGRSRWERVEFPGANVWLRRGFLSVSEATQMLERLISTVPWRQDKIKIFGKSHDIPRLQQWYGDEGQVYRWSGIEMHPLPWTQELLDLRTQVEAATKRKFNSVLLNYYRSGEDCVGWHSDDEKGLGLTPFIASLSLGAERDFLLRSVSRKELKVSLPLPNGSLLVMSDDTQANTEHAVPKRKRCKEPRVNATWREFALE